MENKNQVLDLGKRILDKPEFTKYCNEYTKIEKYISKLKPDTQINILLHNISEYD